MAGKVKLWRGIMLLAAGFVVPAMLGGGAAFAQRPQPEPCEIGAPCEEIVPCGADAPCEDPYLGNSYGEEDFDQVYEGDYEESDEYYYEEEAEAYVAPAVPAPVQKKTETVTQAPVELAPAPLPVPVPAPVEAPAAPQQDNYDELFEGEEVFEEESIVPESPALMDGAYNEPDGSDDGFRIEEPQDTPPPVSTPAIEETPEPAPAMDRSGGKRWWGRPY